MNDNIIINTISKIHFAIISVLSFIFLLLFTLFIFLQHGILIQDVSFSNIKAEKLYIKWNEKIILRIKEITVTKTKDESASLETYQEFLTSLKPKLAYLNLFQEIALSKISLNDINAEFKYSDANDGFLKISSPHVDLEGLLVSNNALFHLVLEKCDIIDKDIKINGDIVFNSRGRLELTTALKIQIQNETELELYTHSNREKLRYAVESKNDIKNMKQILRLFEVDPNIKYWIDDAIKLSSLSFQTFYGWLEYKKMQDAYLNIHAKAVANDLIYTYDTKVSPVRTKTTDLEFKNGILYIRPKNTYSYDFFLDKSWLKIDFSKKEELLTLYLLFQGQANKDLLHLLERYEIKLPFIQTKGAIDTDLTLEINLITTDVEAAGDFYAKEAQIHYLGLDIDIPDAHIQIKNSDVKVKDMTAKYKDIASAHVDLDFQAKESRGKLDFRFDSIFFKDKNLSLASGQKPLNVTYFISSEQDYLKIEKSKWKYKEQLLKIDAAKILFDIQNVAAKIPSTKIEAEQAAAALLSGEISFKSQQADLDLTLLQLDYNGIAMDKSTPKLKVGYDKGTIEVESKEPLFFTYNGNKIHVKDLLLDISDDLIKVKNTTLEFGDILKSKISAEYSPKNALGTIDVHDISLQNSTMGTIFKNTQTTRLLLQNIDNATYISSQEYRFEYMLKNSDWFFEVDSLEKIAQKSEILKKYSLLGGHFKAQKKSDEKDLLFWLDSDYKHKIIVDENKPVENYSVQGKFNTQNQETKFKINDVIEIEIKDAINIKADNIGINIDAVINMFENNSSEETKEEKRLPLYVNTTNSYLYLSENRHVISEKMDFKYFDKTLFGELRYKNGKANFLLKDERFHLYGENFNDMFMEKLFSLSKFKGGSMEFYISGLLKEYDGTIYIKDTTVLDYKILNNVLAFVNTVPSLVTFSLPGYNKNGIAAQNAYMNFKCKDDIYKISDIYLKSKEIEIVGMGEASIKQNKIDLDLNLKTSLGSSLSKIPLLGHILLGKENVSTTLTVTGALDDPDVNTQIAKDIAVAPLNIIKRTLMYPFEIFKDDKKEK